MTSRVAMRRGFLARLTPRERKLIALLVVVFFLVSTTLLFLVRHDRYSEVRESIAAMKRSIELIQRKGSMYTEQIAEKDKKESSIGTETLSFSYQAEQASTKTFGEVRHRNELEKPALDLGGGLTKRVYELELNDVTLDELLKFLQAAETKKGHIIHTNRLMIRSPNHVEDRLRAEIDLATWELRRDALTGDAKEGEDGADSGDSKRATDSKRSDTKRSTSDSKRKGGS